MKEWMSANEGRDLKSEKSTLIVLLRTPITAIEGEQNRIDYTAKCETRLIVSEIRAELCHILDGVVVNKTNM